VIVKPTSAQLLAAVRNDLRDVIGPALSDPDHVIRLGMIDSILASVALRSDHEVAWVREEVAATEAVADRLVAAGHDDGGRIAEALAHLRANRSPSDHLADLHAEYNLAGEVLSRTLEAALVVGGTVQAEAEAVLAARVAREAEIRGEFSLAGRE
jgi:hypothetical protein